MGLLPPNQPEAAEQQCTEQPHGDALLGFPELGEWAPYPLPGPPPSLLPSAEAQKPRKEEVAAPGRTGPDSGPPISCSASGETESSDETHFCANCL